MKWREGDGPAIQFHAQTTDRLALFADNGRVYALAGDKLPGGRGFGEPVRLLIDLDADVGISAFMIARPQARLLVASSDGRGFVTPGEATLAETRKGKQLVNLRAGARVAVVREIPDGADTVAAVGENRKMLVFPLSELPELGRGQGVTLQRYRDGGLSRCHRLPLCRRIELGIGRGEQADADRERPNAVARGARGGGPDAAAGLPEEQPVRVTAPDRRASVNHHGSAICRLQLYPELTSPT